MTSTQVLLDPWTAAVAAAAGKRGDLPGVEPVADVAAGPTRASATPGSAVAEAQSQPSASSAASSLASKFSLPQPNVLHVLRTAYFGAARHIAHHTIASTSARPHSVSATQSGSVTNGASQEKECVEEREAKRLKAVGAGEPNFGTSSRRGVAALRRLCTALGVYTQRADVPQHGVSYAVASSRGWRVAMEDTYAAEVPLPGTSSAVSLFAVYDGHGGAEVARYSALHMGRAIRDAPSAAAAFGPRSANARRCAASGSACATTADHLGVTPDPTPCSSLASADNSADGSADADAELLTATATGTGTTSTAAAADGADACGSTASSPRRVAPSHRRQPPPAAPSPYNGAPAAGTSAAVPASDAATVAATREALREAFLFLDGQLADEAQARQLMALANPGALTTAPEAYGRRSAGGPFLGPAAGSTATVALVGPRGVTVAAVGDSRCILGSRAGGVVAMSVDHKATDLAERDRVVRAGCWVSASGRVCGELDMSRALGDADMKQAPSLPPHLQAVTAEPTVLHLDLESAGGRHDQGGGIGGRESTAADGGSWGRADEAATVADLSVGAERGGTGGGGGGAGAGPATCGGGAAAGGDGGGGGGGFHGSSYLLIASDGLWNVMDNDKVHEFVMERLEARQPAENICAQLCVEACVSERTAYDNVTVLLVLLRNRQPRATPVATGATEAEPEAAMEAEALAPEAAETEAALKSHVRRQSAGRDASQGPEDDVDEASAGSRLTREVRPAASWEAPGPGGVGPYSSSCQIGERPPGMGDGLSDMPGSEAGCRVTSLYGKDWAEDWQGEEPEKMRAGAVRRVWPPVPSSSPHAVLYVKEEGGVAGGRTGTSQQVDAFDDVSNAGLAERLLEASPIHDEIMAV